MLSKTRHQQQIYIGFFLIKYIEVPIGILFSPIIYYKYIFFFLWNIFCRDRNILIMIKLWNKSVVEEFKKYILVALQDLKTALTPSNHNSTILYMNQSQHKSALSQVTTCRPN